MIDKKESNFIKFVAVVAMLIDHIGAYLVPMEILRIIGRIAFPIFAYQLTLSYSLTSDKKGYLKRLLFFAIISQIPFYLLTGGVVLNIIFSLLLGFLAIWAIENKRVLFIYLLVVPLSFFVEYSLYGLLIILIFYFINSDIQKILLFSLLTFFNSFYHGYEIQLFAVLALLFIFGPKIKMELPKYFFYVFYPAHLMIIYVIKIMIQ